MLSCESLQAVTMTSPDANALQMEEHPRSAAPSVAGRSRVWVLTLLILLTLPAAAPFLVVSSSKLENCVDRGIDTGGPTRHALGGEIGAFRPPPQNSPARKSWSSPLQSDLARFDGAVGCKAAPASRRRSQNSTNMVEALVGARVEDLVNGRDMGLATDQDGKPVNRIQITLRKTFISFRYPTYYYAVRSSRPAASEPYPALASPCRRSTASHGSA